MDADAIRMLVENFTINQLVEAEQAIVSGLEPTIDVAGNDAGEKLTNLLAATYVLEKMKAENIDLAPALRQYHYQVRESI